MIRKELLGKCNGKKVPRHDRNAVTPVRGVDQISVGHCISPLELGDHELYFICLLQKPGPIYGRALGLTQCWKKYVSLPAAILYLPIFSCLVILLF